MALPFTISRPFSAWAPTAAGVWTSFGNNIPAITDLGLHVWGAATELVPNNSFAGAVPGVGGTIPNVNFGDSAITRQLSVGSVDGLPCVDIRYQGVPSSTSVQSITFGGANYGSVGETYTNSARLALTAGSLPPSINYFVLRAGGDGFATDLAGLSATLKRYINTRTLAAANGRCTLRWDYTDTVTPVDFTLRIAAPSSRLGTQADPLILTTGASAGRVPDWVWSILPPELSTATAYTLVAWGAPEVSSGTSQYLASLSDGTNNNRVGLSFESSSATARLFVTTGGTSRSFSVGAWPVGTARKFGVTVDGTSAAACLDGGAVATSVGPIPPGITQLRIGSSGNASYPLLGRIGGIKLIAGRRVSNAELQALTS